MIKSRDGEITETGQDLLSQDREIFLCLGKNGTERDQTGQLTRLWVVVPENYRIKMSPVVAIDGFLITSDPKIISLGEGTYCIHLPVLFPQVKQTTTGVPIPKSKIVKAALERKISAVFKANVLSTPEKLDEEQGDIYAREEENVKISMFLKGKAKYLENIWKTCLGVRKQVFLFTLPQRIGYRKQTTEILKQI